MRNSLASNEPRRSRRRLVQAILPDRRALRGGRWLLGGVILFIAAARSLSQPATSQPTSPPTTAAAKQFKTRDGQVLPPAAQLVELEGDPVNGERVFKNTRGPNCINCHQIGNIGRMIGPPLDVIGKKLSRELLFESILKPSASIPMGFENWTLRTKSGDIFSGLKAEDTADHVTILETDGKYRDVNRDQIERMVQQTISLMPEGLNEAITRQELVDLVEFLSSLTGE